MDVSKYLTKGTVTGALSAAAMVATVFGRPALAAVFTSPETAETVLAVASGLGALVAGVAQGVKAPEGR
jgi:hypothetical protein